MKFKTLRILWAAWFFILFVVVFAILYIPFYILLSNPKWYNAAHKLRKFWGYCIVYPSGLFPIVIFEEKPDINKTYIFCPNHFSYLDIIITTLLIPNYFNFMAKDELTKIFGFNIFFKTIDIPVNRRSIKKSHEAFKIADERIKNGASILVFPEGGIKKNYPNLSNFKSGAFRLAIENQIPIVPITIIDNWKRMSGGGFSNGLLPGKMRMVIHRAIPTIGLKPEQKDELKGKVFGIIDAELKKYLKF
ncbi:MAG: 1-acyl-sn-glycerol-3-phosphate acyltransferase [Bacteroidetes bacterium]|nr:1-acyl-sn-glycerol-3-phosphate acyltransferase [Bacteroidota bacterium]